MDWKLYSETRPDEPGIYLWRLPSQAVKGKKISFFAEFKKRWCGHQDEVHPTFGHWTGFRITTPDGLEWTRDNSFTLNSYGMVNAAPSFEGLEFSPCPFCGKTPRLASVNRTMHGVSLTAQAHEHNTFWLECCQWGQTPHVSDPYSLEESRIKAFNSIRGITP